MGKRAKFYDMCNEKANFHSIMHHQFIDLLSLAMEGQAGVVIIRSPLTSAFGC